MQYSSTLSHEWAFRPDLAWKDCSLTKDIKAKIRCRRVGGYLLTSTEERNGAHLVRQVVEFHGPNSMD